MKFTTRQIALMGLLAAINGVLEITLGNYLHLLQFYFTGNIMIGFNCIVYLMGKKAISQRGTILVIGFISALIKFILGWNINAAIAILIEALLMELTINIIGFNIVGAVTGAVMANMWALFQKLIVLGIIGGAGFINTIKVITDKTAMFFNIDKGYMFLLIMILLFCYSLWGVLFGTIGWKLTGRLSSKIYT
ncbi:MAG TPA: hypothetical protein PL110_08890 [Candidatus Eremiobacteraeota bacterium]|nr:hypothetical protein [Candidatus Eremiobacteraeota bacterium]